jgi:hypothetical protein
LIKKKASTANERSFLITEAARRELEAAGWKVEIGMGGAIWQNPQDGYWYDELRALALLKEGLDPGDPS